MRIMTPQTYRPNGIPHIWIRDASEVFDALCAIARERQVAKLNGYLVTPYVAAQVVRVYHGMMPKSRKKFIDRPLPQVIKIALEIVG
jgi:predicted alpha/beta superfamily hydrolase